MVFRLTRWQSDFLVYELTRGGKRTTEKSEPGKSRKIDHNSLTMNFYMLKLSTNVV